MKKRPKLKGFTETVEDYYNAAKDGKILRMGIQIDTPPCNWRCPYCYADETPNETKVEAAPIEEMLSWIDQGVQLGATGLTVNGTFEPTTGRDLFTVLEHSVEKGLNTMMVTNGTGLNERTVGMLRDLDISVLIKLNAPIARLGDINFEEYRKFQAMMSGKKESSRIYEHIIRKFDLLKEYGFNTKIIQGNDVVTSLGVESVIVKSNLHYLRELSKQLRENNVYSHFEVVKVQGSCTKNVKLAPSPEELKYLFFGILEDDLRDGYVGFRPHPPYVGGTCYQNLIRLNIAANGEVQLCPGIDIKIGDLRKQSMEEIVNGSDVLKIVRDLEKQIQGSCKTCDYMIERECYAGCRGMAYQEMKKKGFSDFEALVSSDPSCWRVNHLLDLK
ncbi:MAG: radical SAM protein [Nanoarchaeota archaeon]|nr:radical SAM protein [Nanoarchaeota archaeon]